MEDQFNPIVVENSLNDKKVWQTPVIEIINRDNVKSGSIPAVEGQFTIHGSIGSS